MRTSRAPTASTARWICETLVTSSVNGVTRSSKWEKGWRLKKVHFDSANWKKSAPVDSQIGSRSSLARFRVRVALAEGGFSCVRHFDPLRVRRGLGAVVVVPVPPLVRRGLGVTLWRVLPSLLTAERRDVEVAPGSPHGLVSAGVDEVCAEHLVAFADERIVAVPLVHAEVDVEAVCDGVPRHLPIHSRLQALDVLLWRARGVRERGGAGVQMCQVGDLIGAQGAAAAGVLGPAEHPGLEEGAIDDQLTAAL